MNPTEQLAHFSGGTNDLSMTGLWYSHKRVAQLVEAAKAEALREARDAIHRDCSTCGNTGRVDWEPGAHRNTEADDQPCPDCRAEQAIRDALGLDWAFAQFGADGEPRWRQVAGKWQEVPDDAV